MSRIRTIAHNLRLIFSSKIAVQMGEIEHRLNLRADGYEKAVDMRFDETFERLERRADERFEVIERRTDERFDIIGGRLDERLEAIERRLDERLKPHEKQDPQSDGHPTLYQRIIDWKEKALDELYDFSADEQEVVNYILSFNIDPGYREDVTQHMRRFIGTLSRIPPPQSPADRLLALGSLVHLAPALNKFCRYQEVCFTLFWESDEKLVYETVAQKDGPEAHTFELHNFNVERDPFPWPDNHFRVALCCEILEHLQSDPLHMLWEINRVLAPGGFLLLTTPNIVSARSIEGLLVGCAPYLLAQYSRKTPLGQRNPKYAPFEVGVALAAAGFTVEELETVDVWMRSNPAIIELLKEVKLPTDNRGDNIFALARKTSAPIERYPKDLYSNDYDQ